MDILSFLFKMLQFIRTLSPVQSYPIFCVVLYAIGHTQKDIPWILEMYDRLPLFLAKGKKMTLRHPQEGPPYKRPKKSGFFGLMENETWWVG